MHLGGGANHLRLDECIGVCALLHLRMMMKIDEANRLQ
jgi:hypothetical protein